MSSQETTDNFWQVWNNFKWPDPVVISYRCYYLDDGSVDVYTMEALSGNYIEVSKEQYLAAAKPAQVVDGQLKIIQPKITVQKLTPVGDTGTLCHNNDVAVVVDSTRAAPAHHGTEAACREA